MGSIVKYFTWCLSDINLCLSSRYYSTNSSTYTIGDSLCTFYLKFRFDENNNEVSVHLCRCWDDGPTLITVNFSLSLQTVSGHILHTFENSYSFLNGCRNGFTEEIPKVNLVAFLPNEHEKEHLIVICRTVLLEPSFVFLNEDIGALSASLLELRSENSYANAHLIAEGERIPVHKEILSARSPVFEQFRKGDCYYDDKFSAVVVKAMLDFLYSGDISKMDLSNPEQLYFCAMHYKISDLIKLLKPERTFTTSIVNRMHEVHTLQFENFTTLCRTFHSVEHPEIKMHFNEDIEMIVKVLFKHFNKSGEIIFETTLWNISNVESIFVRLFILDNSGERRHVSRKSLETKNESSITFSFSYESAKLFSARNLILPKDVLSLNYELQFRLMGEFHISDPEILKESNFDCLSRKVSCSLITNMESQLRSERFADALLVLPPVQSNIPTSAVINVHKSILSARSPVLKDMLRTDQYIYMDFPENVVKHLLHYMYTGVLLTIRPGMLDSLYKAAEAYRINPLKRACEVIVQKITLDTKNVFPMYSIAVRANLSNLKKSCVNFVLQNKDIILGSFRWEKLREKHETAFEEIKSCITKKS